MLSSKYTIQDNIFGLYVVFCKEAVANMNLLNLRTRILSLLLKVHCRVVFQWTPNQEVRFSGLQTGNDNMFLLP
jgi:hypothetical protein